MALADEIDGPTAPKEPACQPRPSWRVRDLIYLQLAAVTLCVVFGQCERWGYAHILEIGLPGAIFGPVVLALFWTAPIFPAVLIAVLRRERTRRSAPWMVAALCFAMSFTQILALLPLFQ
jgi:hypothetical protein